LRITEGLVLARRFVRAALFELSCSHGSIT
jgi:hypothetical protein